MMPADIDLSSSPGRSCQPEIATGIGRQTGLLNRVLLMSPDGIERTAGPEILFLFRNISPRLGCDPARPGLFISMGAQRTAFSKNHADPRQDQK